MEISIGEGFAPLARDAAFRERVQLQYEDD
jgi:hypothetical protein